MDTQIRMWPAHTKTKLQSSRMRTTDRLHSLPPCTCSSFTAVDRNGVIRFFDIMQGKDEFSVAETATTAPRLARCRETVYEVPRTAEFHHVHRNYGSYNQTNTPSAFLAMNQFAKACGLTQVTKTAETLNQQEALPTWEGIFQGLGCPTRSFSFKSVASFTG